MLHCMTFVIVGVNENMLNLEDFFLIVDTRILFYSRNTNMLPPKPKSSFRLLKRGMEYVYVSAFKAANSVVVV